MVVILIASARLANKQLSLDLESSSETTEIHQGLFTAWFLASSSVRGQRGWPKVSGAGYHRDISN